MDGCALPVTTLHDANGARIVQQIEQQGGVGRHHELYALSSGLQMLNEGGQRARVNVVLRLLDPQQVRLRFSKERRHQRQRT